MYLTLNRNQSYFVFSPLLTQDLFGNSNSENLNEVKRWNGCITYLQFTSPFPVHQRSSADKFRYKIAKELDLKWQLNLRSKCKIMLSVGTHCFLGGVGIVQCKNPKIIENKYQTVGEKQKWVLCCEEEEFYDSASGRFAYCWLLHLLYFDGLFQIHLARPSQHKRICFCLYHVARMRILCHYTTHSVARTVLTDGSCIHSGEIRNENASKEGSRIHTFTLVDLKFTCRPSLSRFFLVAISALWPLRSSAARTAVRFSRISTTDSNLPARGELLGIHQLSFPQQHSRQSNLKKLLLKPTENWMVFLIGASRRKKNWRMKNWRQRKDVPAPFSFGKY